MKRAIITTAVSLAGIAIVALLIYGVANQGLSRALDNEVAKGEKPAAPEASVKLPLLTGGRASIASYRGKVILLNFWASWCTPCQQEAPMLEKTQEVLKRHDGTVLGVTYLDAAPDSRGFIHEYHLTYPNMRDGTGAFSHGYGTDQVPESFMINREGQVVAISRGEVTTEWLNRALKAAAV